MLNIGRIVQGSPSIIWIFYLQYVAYYPYHRVISVLVMADLKIPLRKRRERVWQTMELYIYHL